MSRAMRCHWNLLKTMFSSGISNAYRSNEPSDSITSVGYLRYSICYLFSWLFSVSVSWLVTRKESFPAFSNIILAFVYLRLLYLRLLRDKGISKWTIDLYHFLLLLRNTVFKKFMWRFGQSKCNIKLTLYIPVLQFTAFPRWERCMHTIFIPFSLSRPRAQKWDAIRPDCSLGQEWLQYIVTVLCDFGLIGPSHTSASQTGPSLNHFDLITFSKSTYLCKFRFNIILYVYNPTRIS